MAVSDPFDRQEPTRRGAVEGSPARKEKKERREREREEAWQHRRLNGSAKLTMIYGVGVPQYHSINIALFDRQITHRRSRLRTGFDTFYFTGNK